MTTPTESLPDALSIGAFYRLTRDEWLVEFTKAEAAGEDGAEAAIEAMDTLYAYFLSHGLIERDAVSYG